MIEPLYEEDRPSVSPVEKPSVIIIVAAVRVLVWPSVTVREPSTGVCTKFAPRVLMPTGLELPAKTRLALVVTASGSLYCPIPLAVTPAMRIWYAVLAERPVKVA